MEIGVDSELSKVAALAQNPGSPCPEETLKRQTVLTIRYWSFDSRFQEGQLVVDERLAGDVRKVFAAAAAEKFPIWSIIPAADPRFAWDDEVLMAKNNTSGFNYRTIAGQE